LEDVEMDEGKEVVSETEPDIWDLAFYVLTYSMTASKI